MSASRRTRCKNDLDVGVERMDALGSDFDLRAADVGGRVQDLPLQVRRVHDIVVDEHQASHSRRSEVERRRAAETPGPDQDDRGVQQPGLPFDTELRQTEMSPVTIELIRTQTRTAPAANHSASSSRAGSTTIL